MSDTIDSFFTERINVPDILKRYDRAETKAASYRRKWSEIDEEISYSVKISPSLRATGTSYVPQPRDSESNNSTGYVIGIINKIVNQLCSLLCDPAYKWLGLNLGVLAIMDLSVSKATNRWLEQICRLLYRLFSDSNSRFYTTTAEIIRDWYIYGTGCREQTVSGSRILFNAVHPDSISAELSGFGDIDTVYRTHILTARQAVDLWGNVPINVGGLGLHRSVLDAYHSDIDTKFTFVEICMPNIFGFELKKKIGDGMPIAPYLSLVVDKNNNWLTFVGMQNYKSYIVSRFEVSSGDLYGRSVVWDAMRDIMTVNLLNVLALENIEYIVAPPIAVKNAMSLLVDRIAPRSVVAMLDPANNSLGIQPVQYSGDPSILMPFYQLARENLNLVLLANDIILPDIPARTAFEIAERKAQMTNRLRPMVVRLEQEDLTPVVQAMLSVLGPLLPPFPYEEVADEMNIDPLQLAQLLPDPISQLHVTFAGQLSKMQKLQDLAETQQVLQTTLEASREDPSIKYEVSLPKFVKALIRNYNIDPSVINSDEYVDNMKERDNQLAQLQAQIQQLQVDKMRLENEGLQLKNREIAQGQ